jgi:thiamine biosynthesis lipoprotein
LFSFLGKIVKNQTFFWQRKETIALKRTLSLFLILLLVLPFLNGCSRAPKEQTYYSYFDTFTTLSSYANDSKADFRANCQAITTLLARLHKLFDIYHAYDGLNNLYTVNQMAGVSPVKVEQELIDFLLYTKEIYTLTSGETNIAMGAVLSLWHNTREIALKGGAATLPDEERLFEAALHTNIDCLVIDEEAGTVYLTDSAMSLDVGAIGKGYAVEKAATLLEERGVTGYVLNVGGNLRAIGTKRENEGWVTGVRDPEGDGLLARLQISNAALVTSGNYERYYTVEGNRYHHIIDKDTMFPAKGFSSVTVYAADSALADALSTALFCMTYEEGTHLLSSLPDAEALWVTDEGNILMTDGMRQKLLP